jgi:hypothetical protein
MSKFNIIGPELNDSELKPLRDICNKALLANSKNPLFYLKTFEEICAELVELEKKHESGVEINIENNEEFRELAETCGGFLVRCSFRISLCSYYFAMIRSISEENQLGTCILRFHEPWLFSGAIIGLIQDGLIKCNPPGEITQQDFDRWKKNLLIFVKKEWEYQY